ncbi:MAG: ATP-binding protein, partial [Anaerolineae bacterium]|nr:ATP-binding protein [Anaerolineae bacterium]
MLATVTSCAVVGLEGELVQAEVDISRGLPSWTLVGLPDAAVRESGERVRSAIRNSGLAFPQGRLTVNLAPADLRKEGPAYDLPIAIGVLIASEQLFPLDGKAMIIGELSLDGSVRHVKGVLPMAAKARDAGLTTLYVPQADAPEAALIEELTVYPVSTLGHLFSHLLKITPIERYEPGERFDAGDPPSYATDFQEIKGQEHVKRALEVAASGGHNLMMMGPPGAGKTLLARSMPGILPRLSLAEALDITRIYSVADMIPDGVPLIRHRPF